MSEKNSKKNPNIKLEEKVKNKKETKEQTEKEEKINPLSLLSKDLLDEINSLEQIDLGDKKDSINDGIQLDETQKEGNK